MSSNMVFVLARVGQKTLQDAEQRVRILLKRG